MSQFSLVLIGRHENREEPVAQALATAFGQGIEWGRPVVLSAPIVLLEGLSESQGQAIHAALRNVEQTGCKIGLYPTGSPDVDGCSKLRWPTPPTINGYALNNYGGPDSNAGLTAAATQAQITCPHCGTSFILAFNVLPGAAPNSPRSSARQLSPATGMPTPGSNLTSSGSYAAQPPTAPSVPVGFGAQGVGTSSGFYQLPGSNAMIGPVNPQGPANPMLSSGPATPAGATGGVSGSGTINLPAAQPLPRARSVTPNPASQQPQPGLGLRPNTPDRGQARPSPNAGQRQISPSMGQPTGGRPQQPTPGTGTVPPRKPNSGHYGKPEGIGALPGAGPSPTTRPPIELPPAQPLPTGAKPASNTAIPTLPPAAGGVAEVPAPLPPAKALPNLSPLGGSEYSDLQGPMSLDEFEAHISGIHAPIEPPPPGKKPPPSNRPGPRRPNPPRR